MQLVLNSSYTAAAFDSTVTAFLNDDQLIKGDSCFDCWLIYHAQFNQNAFSPNSTSMLSVYNGTGGGLSGQSYLGIVLLYQE